MNHTGAARRDLSRWGMLPFRLVTSALLALPIVVVAADGVLPAAPSAEEVLALGLPNTIAPDAKVAQLANGFLFTEGATSAANGDVYFVDQPNDKILRWEVATNQLHTFLHPAGRSNGQYFDRQGSLIACADEKNELWSIKPDGSHTVLVSSSGYEGRPLDGPNDVWVRPDGGLYITDPLYKRTWWDPAVTRPSQPVRSVYFLAPGAKTLKRVAELTMPNGIVGTPDGRTLYVADINARQTWSYAIQADGTLTDRKFICPFGSDGMTLDERGNLYLSASLRPPGAPRGGPSTSGVTVVDTKTGKVIGFIPVPEQPANMCFGGKNHDVLYMTARTGFYSIPTRVKGANPAK